MDGARRVRWVRILYYGGVVAVGALAHSTLASDLAGSGVAGLARRNSEAYVLMLLIPLYWDAVSGHSMWRRLVWYPSLAVAAILTQTPAIGEYTTTSLPDGIVTLGEAFVAVLVMSVYFDVTRSRRWDKGMAPVSWRVGYYLVVFAVVVVVHQSFFLDPLGQSAATFFAINTEAYAAIVIIPLYFDFVGPTAVAGRELPGSAGLSYAAERVIWYGFLVTVPLVAAATSGSVGLMEPLRDWLTLTTEAFLAAIVVSAYFDVLRWPSIVRLPLTAESGS